MFMRQVLLDITKRTIMVKGYAWTGIGLVKVGLFLKFQLYFLPKLFKEYRGYFISFLRYFFGCSSVKMRLLYPLNVFYNV